MEKLYYIIENGNQQGPFTISQLSFRNVQPTTYVWTEGMADWAQASTLPELSSLFGYTGGNLQRPINGYNAGQPFQQPAQQQPQNWQQSGNGYGNNYGNYDGTPVPHTNWMPWAIVCIVAGIFFSCITMILGIIATTKASSANRSYQMGDKTRGDSENTTARTLCIVGFVFLALGLIVTIFWMQDVFWLTQML